MSQEQHWRNNESDNRGSQQFSSSHGRNVDVLELMSDQRYSSGNGHGHGGGHDQTLANYFNNGNSDFGHGSGNGHNHSQLDFGSDIYGSNGSGSVMGMFRNDLHNAQEDLRNAADDLRNYMKAENQNSPLADVYSQMARLDLNLANFDMQLARQDLRGILGNDGPGSWNQGDGGCGHHHGSDNGAGGQNGGQNGGSDAGSGNQTSGSDSGSGNHTTNGGSDGGTSNPWTNGGSDGGTSNPPTNGGSDAGSGNHTTNGGSDAGSGNHTTNGGSDGGTTNPPTNGGDTGSGTQTPPSDVPPVTGKSGTPTDAQSALAGFALPSINDSSFIQPQFGNGKSDTQAIQDAVDKAAAQGGGVVKLPPGTFNIDSANDGIIMKSGVTLLMDKDTVLKGNSNGSENGCIIDIRNVNNVNIYGGKLVGDYGPNGSHTGETMSGIDVLGSSSHIDIQGVESDNNKGDGFDISGSGSDIHIAHCVAQGNKRDGLSVEGGSQILVEYNAFINQGTHDSYDNNVPSAARLPVSGIDIENSPGQSVSNTIVRNNLLEGNGNSSIDANTSNGWGIRVTGDNGHGSQVLDNTVVGNAAGGVGVWSGDGNVVQGNLMQNQPHPYEIFGGSATGDGNTNDGSQIGPVNA